MSDHQRIPSFWRGYITGTNRGRVWLRIRTRRRGTTANAVLFDHQWGPTLLGFTNGQLSENSLLQLRLTTIHVSAPAIPLDGQATIPLPAGARSESVGSWWTDIGSSGVLVIRPISFGWLQWMAAKTGAVALRFFPGTLRLLYVVGLFSLGILGTRGVLQLSAWELVLMLLPGPFLLRPQIKAILVDLGVSKAGPLEFKQQIPPTMGMPERPSEVEGVVPNAQQDTAYLAALDEFFAPITKSLLRTLSLLPDGMEIPQFIKTAKSLRVQEANIPTILHAITSTGVAQLRDGRVILTDLGRAWLQRWMYISATPSPNSTPETTEGA